MPSTAAVFLRATGLWAERRARAKGHPRFLVAEADRDEQYRNWGLPLGRRFRALKAWFHLRLEGAAAIRERIGRDLANAQWLATRIEAAPGWVVLAPVRLQTVCVRHEPEGLAGTELDRHTLRWVTEINDSGFAYLTAAKLGERWMVRVSIGAEATQRDDVAALWQRMQ